MAFKPAASCSSSSSSLIAVNDERGVPDGVMLCAVPLTDEGLSFDGDLAYDILL